PIRNAFRIFRSFPIHCAKSTVNIGARSAQSEKQDARNSPMINSVRTAPYLTCSITYRIPKQRSRVKIILNPQNEITFSPLYSSENARQNGISDKTANSASLNAYFFFERVY